MKRTTRRRLLGAMTLLILFSVAAAACSEQRAKPEGEPEEAVRDVSEFVPGHGPGAPAYKPSAESETGEKPSEGLSRPMPSGPAQILAARHEISGTIHLAEGVTRPSAGGTLFVIARRPGTAGPPTAVQRIPDPKFPHSFRITAREVLGGGVLEGELELSARLDLDGDVSTKEPEGLLGAYEHNPVRLGQTGIVIALSSDGKAVVPEAAAPAAAAPPMIPEKGPPISGTIRIAPGAKAPPGGVLYVMARSNTHPDATPMAVKRIEDPQFPAAYQLGREDALAHQQAFVGAVNISAIVDADGDANTQGDSDLAGSFAGNPAQLGQSGVDIVLAPR
jgi:hypothetical protein